MREFKNYPKALKKIIRFILQDASLAQIDEYERVLAYYIRKRRYELKSAHLIKSCKNEIHPCQ